MKKALLKLYIIFVCIVIFLLIIGCFQTPLDPDYYLNNPDAIYGGPPPPAPNPVIFRARYPGILIKTNYFYTNEITNISIITENIYDIVISWRDMSQYAFLSNYSYTVYINSNLPGGTNKNYLGERITYNTIYTSYNKYTGVIYNFGINFFDGLHHSITNATLFFTNN